MSYESVSFPFLLFLHVLDVWYFNTYIKPVSAIAQGPRRVRLGLLCTINAVCMVIIVVCSIKICSFMNHPMICCKIPTIAAWRFARQPWCTLHVIITCNKGTTGQSDASTTAEYTAKKKSTRRLYWASIWLPMVHQQVQVAARIPRTRIEFSPVAAFISPAGSRVVSPSVILSLSV